MNEDVIKGATQNGLGSMKDVAGRVLGDRELELKGKAEKMVGKAQETYGRVKETAIQRVDELGDYVRERPYAALAVAAIVGVVLGHLMSSSRPSIVYLRDH